MYFSTFITDNDFEFESIDQISMLWFIVRLFYLPIEIIYFNKKICHSKFLLNWPNIFLFFSSSVPSCLSHSHVNTNSENMKIIATFLLLSEEMTHSTSPLFLSYSKNTKRNFTLLNESNAHS